MYPIALYQSHFKKIASVCRDGSARSLFARHSDGAKFPTLSLPALP